MMHEHKQIIRNNIGFNIVCLFFNEDTLSKLISFYVEYEGEKEEILLKLMKILMRIF